MSRKNCWKKGCMAAMNGFAKSLRIKNMMISDESCRLSSPIKIDSGLKTYLASPAGLSLTRTTILYFEAFYTTSPMTEYHLYNIEMVKAMLMGGCGKITATIAHQCPEMEEVTEVWEEFRAEITTRLNSSKKLANEQNGKDTILLR
eukprot:4295862-Amphidinium_carterae.1